MSEDPLGDLSDAVDWPDADAERRTRDHLAALRPGGAGLGRLRDVVIWLSATQGQSPPLEPTRVRAVVFGSSTDAAAETTNESGTDITHIAAETADAGVRLELLDTTEGNGLDPSAAVARGAAVADEEIDAGAELLIAAHTGGQADEPAAIRAAVVVSVLTNTEPAKMVANDGSLGDADWSRAVAAIRDARVPAFAHRHDPSALLSTAAGADIAALAGFLIRAAGRRTPVLVDGPIATAAALLARERAPRAVRWWQLAHGTGSPVHALAVERLYLEPVIDLELGVEQGLGALLILPMIRTAVRVTARAGTETTDQRTDQRTWDGTNGGLTSTAGD